MRVNQEGSKEFGRGSSFLFIVVLLVITEEFKTRNLWEQQYADHLALITGSISELKEKFQLWKQNLESKNFKVNLSKTEVLVSKKTNRTLPHSSR